MEEKKCLKLVCNSKIIEIPVIFANLLKVKQEIAETLILKHEYLVKSKIDNEVFQSFVNMWVYQEELMLDKNNVIFYRELNREFELSLLEEKLKEYENKSKEKDEAGKEINKLFTISEITQILQNDGKEKIGEISERLDDYLDLYNNELMKIDSTLLIRLFNDPRRKLKRHDRAYQIIIKHYEKTHNPEILRILPTLDWEKLDEFNQKDSIEYRHERHFFIPKIDVNTILGKLEELEGKIKIKEAIIDLFINHNEIETPQKFNDIVHLISSFCNEGELDKLRECLSKEIEYGNGVFYKINEENKTASLFKVEGEFDELFIPRTIIDKNTNNEFIVNNIMLDAIREITVNSVRFDENSGIKQIGSSVFYDSTIRCFYISATLTNLNGGWCNSCKNLTKIVISPLNCNFKMIDEKLLFGKSDPKSDIFDVLLFASRDIEKVDIPPYVKKIESYAFDCCTKLQTINIPENSELKEIGKSPFYETQIESLYIPSNLIELKPLWCDFTQYLTNIRISPLNRNFKMIDDKLLLGKSNPKSDIFDVILFARRDIQKVDIPFNIKKISSSAFDHCELLNSVNIPENSELRTIDDYSFFETYLNQINITSNVVEIGKGAFEDCSLLEKVNISSDSKLRLIGISSFRSTSICSFTIPEHVSHIGNFAFSYSDVQIIEFSENSKLKFINKLAFVEIDAIIMIPSVLKNKISI